MGFLNATVENRLREKFFGAGNRYFNAAQSEWEATPKEGKESDESNYLGVYHILQNKLYTQLGEYLGVMYELSMTIFGSYGVPKEEYVGNVGAKTVPGTSNMSLDTPIEDDRSKIVRMLHHGNNIVGEFGNSSLHARYFEWGTGPEGARNKGNVGDTMRKRNEPVQYRDTPWVYYNPYAPNKDGTVGHFVRTEGMPPRPFVYPAFLRLRSAFVNSLKQILEHLNIVNWSAGTYPSHRGARGRREGKR